MMIKIVNVYTRKLMIICILTELIPVEVKYSWVKFYTLPLKTYTPTSSLGIININTRYQYFLFCYIQLLILCHDLALNISNKTI